MLEMAVKFKLWFCLDLLKEICEKCSKTVVKHGNKNRRTKKIIQKLQQKNNNEKVYLSQQLVKILIFAIQRILNVLPPLDSIQKDAFIGGKQLTVLYSMYSQDDDDDGGGGMVNVFNIILCW